MFFAIQYIENRTWVLWYQMTICCTSISKHVTVCIVVLCIPLKGFRRFKYTCYLNYQKISCPSVLKNAKILSYYKIFSVQSLFNVDLGCLIKIFNSLTSFILLMRPALLIKKKFFSLCQ